MESKEKMSFAQRVLAFVKGGEESNVVAIQATAKKAWEKEISKAENNIKALGRKLAEDLEEQNEYLAEATIAYDESFLNVTITKLGHDERKTYVAGDYQRQIATALAKVDSINAKIESLKKVSADTIADYQKMIDTYKNYLAKIA